VCGIAGFVGSANTFSMPDPEGTVKAMAETLRHRGPDEEGCYVGPGVALAHRRLRIIDLETGAQPMTSGNGSHVLVYNGEVYNFRALRSELEKAGHAFVTRSDTEAVLHAYEEYGTRCLDRFNGMFAFALWDANDRRLFAARDRMGQKPFYYSLQGDTLVFASELKALLLFPGIRAAIAPRTLSRYLAFGYVPAPDTIYEGIHKLPPGHFLTYENGELEVKPYWRIDFSRAEVRDDDDAALQRDFLSLFRDAVRLRLMSDVPLGVFLSGGIDSSAVVAMMRDLMPPKDIKTFSVAFREKEYDESSHARAVARHFGTDHHEKVLDEETMLDRLPDLIAHMDEPFADASLSPTSLLSEFTRSEVTVALGGDGGDELFAGYSAFWIDLLATAYARLPRWLRRGLVEAPAHALFDALRLRRARRAVEYIGAGADTPEPWRIMSWSEAALGPRLQSSLLARADDCAVRADSIYADTIAHYAAARDRSRLRQLQRQFQTQYLPDDILTKVDRASMSFSLEVRAPFLDPRVVDYANALPDRWKLRGRNGKVFLKTVFRGLLPESVLTRPKMGFGVPLAEWLRNGLRPIADRAFAPERLEADGLFRPDAVQRLWAEHLSGRRNHRGPLWTLLAFLLWFERHQPAVAIP